MFPSRHFAPRYYAARYWPKVGVTPASYTVLLVAAARAGTASITARAGRTGITARAGAAAIAARTHRTEEP
jgi:hypothetical protein